MKQYRVSVPRIAPLDFETLDQAEESWLSAAGRADPRPNLPELRQPPYWEYYAASPLIRELFRDEP